MHFWADGTDARAYFAEFEAWLSRLAEDGDVVGVSEWAIACDESEEGCFAASVLAFEDPMFAAANGPIEVFEECAAAEADIDVLEVDDDGRRFGWLGAVFVGFWADGWCGLCVCAAEGGGQFVA